MLNILSGFRAPKTAGFRYQSAPKQYQSIELFLDLQVGLSIPAIPDSMQYFQCAGLLVGAPSREPSSPQSAYSPAWQCQSQMRSCDRGSEQLPKSLIQEEPASGWTSPFERSRQVIAWQYLAEREEPLYSLSPWLAKCQVRSVSNLLCIDL